MRSCAGACSRSLEHRLTRLENLARKSSAGPRRCRATLGNAVREARRIAKRLARMATHGGSEQAIHSHDEAERLLDRVVNLRAARCASRQG
jgi:hypothetical protein